MRLSILFVLLFIISCFSGCEKPVSACGCEDPRNEMDWLEGTLEASYFYVDVYVYNKGGVDYIGVSNENYDDNAFVAFYDCDGTLKCIYYTAQQYNPASCKELYLQDRTFLFVYRNPLISK